VNATAKPTQVLIAGDVCPAVVSGDDLAARLQLDEPPDLFVWTLDAAVPAGPPRPGVTCMPFDPAALDSLRLGKSTLVATASNHLSDFGDQGVATTLRQLDEHGYRHVGAGPDRSRAAENAYLDLPAGRVAVLAYAEIHPRVSALAATDSHAGVRPFDIDACLQDIREAKQQADWVWIVLHWGEEFVRFPDPDQRRMAWQLADAGASLVVAAHTHVPLGFERRNDSFIFYGLGNFVFPPYREARGYRYAWHPAACQGVMAAGTFENGAWTWSPREIRLSRDGLPRVEKHGSCPDYGRMLPSQLSDYAEQFPALRNRERLKFMMQRLCFMSWDERAFRLRRLFTSDSTSR
jgi:hypothetical protein